MSCKIKAWINCGYTATNIPDSEATLNKVAASTIFDDLNILSQAWLDSVIVNATKEQVALVDYVKIWDPDDNTSYGTWFYYVSNYQPVQKNAMRLALTPIYMLIGGGVSNLDFITGFLTRKSPEANPICNQGYFEDELMQPAKPLHVKYALVGNQTEVKYTRLTATRIDLGTQAYYKDTVVPIEKDVTDVSGETTTVSKEKIGGALAYQTFINPGSTSIQVAGHYLSGGSIDSANQIIPYVLYMGNQAFIDQGINNLRQIGAEGAIIASYMVPSQYIGSVSTLSRFAGTGTGIDPNTGETVKGMYYGADADLINNGTFVPYARTGAESLAQSNYVSIINSAVKNYSDDLETYGRLPVKINGGKSGIYNGITNDCLYLGPYNAFGIITDGNNKIEVNPERMILSDTGVYGSISSDDTLLSQQMSIVSFADLRPDGRPYFCFSNIDGNTIDSSTLGLFFIYGVAGSQWRNCPLSWTDVSGGKLEENQYKNTVSSQQLSFAQGRQGVWNRFANWLGEKVSPGNGEESAVKGTMWGATGTAAGLALKTGAAGAASQGLTAAGAQAAVAGYGSTGAALGAAGAALPIALGAVAAVGGVAAAGLNTYKKIANNAQAYALEQAQELSSYMSSVGIAVPEISFMPQSNPMRDLTEASAIAYRYQYDYEDMRRIDKLLTAFGWKTCVVPVKADLTRHQAFDYLEGDVQVKAAGDTPFPKWLADGISAELSAGVRIWHQAPITITADCNPVKE